MTEVWGSVQRAVTSSGTRRTSAGSDGRLVTILDGPAALLIALQLFRASPASRSLLALGARFARVTVLVMGAPLTGTTWASP